MRQLTDYLPYKTATPPHNGRWLSVGAGMTLISGGGAALMPAEARGGALITVAIVSAMLLVLIIWMLRLLYYRLSVHYTQYYQRLIDFDHQTWWARHQYSVGLVETVLLGPVGCEPERWQTLLKREHQPPKEKLESGARALRLIHSDIVDIDLREQQLARMLAQQWLAQRGEHQLPGLSGCYWQGSEPAWREFCAELRKRCPTAQLPHMAEPWQGEASLSEITARINESGDECFILVAGCQSVAATADSARPAGESAVLWLLAREGEARLTRGEVYEGAAVENIQQVCQRAMQQSGAERPPDPCIAFTQPQIPELAQSGWNSNQLLQDENWGETGQMEQLITIALAAIFARRFQQSCGWIARDPRHPLSLGIVTAALPAPQPQDKKE
ncbi:hypothetical protein PGN83_09310 [Klebsiella aerogenes]|nr:hypothetical protein [Klebsiella aerogenes]